MIGTRFVQGRGDVTAAVTVTVALPVRGLAAPTTAVKPVHLIAQATVSPGRSLTGSRSLTQIAAISRRDARHFFNSYA